MPSDDRVVRMTADSRQPVVILLGAGASKPAGLPTAVEMTRRVFDSLKDSDALKERRIYERGIHALAVVIGGLQLKAAFELHDPFCKVDIEQVIGAWHPVIEYVDRIHPSELKYEELQNALKEFIIDARNEGLDVNPHSVVWSLYNVLEALAQQGTGAIFDEVLDAINKVLVKILWLPVEAKTRVEYLSPLASAVQNHSPLKVFTLNYDNAVERWAISRTVHLSRGFDRYYTEYLDFPDDCEIHLYKLHGSVDWHYTRHDPKTDKTVAYPWTTVGEHDPFSPFPPRDPPALVFGRANKLSTDGPFFDLLSEFSTNLNNTEHLVIIGYSFRDAHVNDVIGRWLNRGTERRITVFNGTSADKPSLRGTGFEEAHSSGRLQLDPLDASDAFGKVPELIRSASSA